MKNKAPLPLRQTLAQQPWRLLLYIGRQRGLQLSSSITKADLIGRLETALPTPATLHPALLELTPTAYTALMTMVTAGGQVPLRHLLPRYGPLRPPRQTPGHYGAASSGGIQFLSPLEELRASGLAFENRADHVFHIPVELINFLPSPAPTAPAETSKTGRVAGPSSTALLVHDLTCLLALLQKSPPRLLHQRWLPPQFLQTWGRHCSRQPSVARPASELKTDRRRFLHYLALQAGLLSGPAAGQANLLALSPAAWRWLAAAPAEQYQTLWHAWQQPVPARWQQFQLPGADWLSQPTHLMAHLHPTLLDSHGPFDPDNWSAALVQRHLALLDLLPAGSHQPDSRLQKTLTALLRGPLQWLGVVSPVLVDEAASVQFQVTPFGRCCLNGNFDQLDDVTPESSYHLASQNLSQPLQATLSLTSHLNRLPAPAHLFSAMCSGRLDPFSSPASASDDNTAASGRYTLSAATFIAALHRGWTPVALVKAINRLADRSLTAAEHNLLQQWAELANQVTIRPALLLETDQPEVIVRLTGSRRGRDAIQRSHSPRLVEVDPTRLPALVRRLTAQEGVPPRVITGDGKPGPFAATDLPAPAQWWVTAKVYQALGQFIQLPLRFPTWQLEQIEAHLTPEQVAAAEVTAAQTLEALQQVIDGWAAYAPWPEAGLPVDDSQPIIERALQSGQWLELTYYAASTNRLTHRIVEPHRLEWRGDTPYLIGFCHHAQAERTFRLDRIKRIVRAESDSDG